MTDSPELAALKRQLFEASFPLWSTVGVDATNGGFFERLTPDGTVIDDPRRARLVGRQIYSFAMAERLGWGGPGRAMVQHGLSYLLGHMVQDDRIVPLTDASGKALSSTFDLYDQAFVLFGLAAAASIGEQVDTLTKTARRIRDHMLRGWKHPEAGFEESIPRSLPLKANPHMHMLEASLAWAEIDSDAGWNLLADEIVELALKSFLSRETGALHEFFDGDWNMLHDPAWDVVEPGHQSEWAWLLIRWGLSRNRPDAIEAARRLISVAEDHGVSDLKMAINELNPDLSTRDRRHRLWPQTERIKAFVALGWVETTSQSQNNADAKVAEAARGLLQFFEHPVRGAWWEHLDPEGAPATEPSRASSLYHITCAVTEMARR